MWGKITWTSSVSGQGLKYRAGQVRMEGVLGQGPPQVWGSAFRVSEDRATAVCGTSHVERSVERRGGVHQSLRGDLGEAVSVGAASSYWRTVSSTLLPLIPICPPSQPLRPVAWISKFLL